MPHITEPEPPAKKPRGRPRKSTDAEPAANGAKDSTAEGEADLAGDAAAADSDDEPGE